MLKNVFNTIHSFIFGILKTNNPSISKKLFLLPIFFLVLTVFGFPANAKYASFVINENTKRIYHNTNADTRNYPASLTKIMTLYMIFDALESKKISMNTKLKVSNLFSLLIKLICHYNKSRPAIIQTSMYMIGNIAMVAKIFSFHKPKIIIGAHSDFDSTCKASKNLAKKFFDRNIHTLQLEKILQLSINNKSNLVHEVTKDFYK